MTDTLFPDSRPSISAEESEAARETLRRQIGDLRRLASFPQGTDDSILRMSIPPAFTACPNPFMREWLRATQPPGHEQGPYEDPGPFAADVSVGKTHPMYKAHSYPTKVPHQAIMRYILHYTRPGDVVLDGFCGSGMTGVAAQACGNPEPDIRQQIEKEMGKVRWGNRRAILQDLSPSATFIAAGLNLPIDGRAFDRRSKKIMELFEAEWGWMYETAHTSGKAARIDYTVWSEVFTCPHCGGEVVFYEAALDKRTGRVKDDFQCLACGASNTKASLERRKVPSRTLAGDVIDRVEFRPVAVHYRIGKFKYDKVPDSGDLEVLRKVAGAKVPWFPSDELPYMHMTHERNNLPAMGFTHIHHLYDDRSLASLAALWNLCSAEPDPLLRLSLLFWVEQALWGMSRMDAYRPTGFSQVSQYLKGVYYVPSLHSECSPWYYLVGSAPSRGKRPALAKLWGNSRTVPRGTMVSTSSSTRLDVPSGSIDYVFIDPPFGGNIYYADLAYLVERWHGVMENPVEEAIIDQNKHRPKGSSAYQSLMQSCFREFFRVLKPGRWLTVEFNNSSNEIWLSIQEALSAAGFVVADTRVFDKEQLSYRQITAANAVKRDLIISAYKPAAELEERFKVVAGSHEGAWDFVTEHLRHLPITEGRRGEARVVRERQGDRLYDRMVAYHIHRGVAVPLAAVEFYAGLERRFPLRDDMYFLPEQVEKYERYRMTIKDLLQAELFITNESSALQWLRQQLKAKPRTFAEIQPPFFSELQAGLPDWEDLPDLRMLLEDNFLQDEQGRWYVPDPKKAEDLEKIRMKALLKEFQTYAESKGKLQRFRSEAVKAGFRDAWARRDFSLIVSIGERLSADAFSEDEQLLYYFDNAKRLAG